MTKTKLKRKRYSNKLAYGGANTAGGILSGIGLMASVIPGAGTYLGAALQGLGTLAGIAGSNVNLDAINQIENNINALKVGTPDAASASEALSNLTSFRTMNPVEVDDIGSDGIFSRKASREASRLNNEILDANILARNNMLNLVESLNNLELFNKYSNLSAFGGPINMSSRKPMSPFGNRFNTGGSIHIKKENRGKFTDYCGGKVTSECIAKGKRSSSPTIRKRATFAANARKWKHDNGGPLNDSQYYNIMEKVADLNYKIWGLNSSDEALIQALNDNTYDYRGYYNKYPSSKANANTHWTDEFKTVYHPTFSNESIYSGKKSKFNPEGLIGGHWNNNTFIPSNWQRNRAEGGPLFTHGGIFSNGTTYIDNGGTHEENPYEGVLIGVDNQGIPNLVEEGELIWNNYVFSNRIQVPKEVKKSLKLKGNTFAEVAKNALKESEERPNDPISKRGLDSIMSKLSTILEELKKDTESHKYDNGGELSLNVDNTNKYITLRTYYPLDDDYKIGHSSLSVNEKYYDYENDTPYYSGYYVNKKPHHKGYNIVTNNCSDATRCALEKTFDKKLKPFLFTTPGDVRDFALEELNGIPRIKGDSIFSPKEGRYLPSKIKGKKINNTGDIVYIPINNIQREFLKNYIDIGNKNNEFSDGGMLKYKYPGLSFNPNSSRKLKNYSIELPSSNQWNMFPDIEGDYYGTKLNLIESLYPNFNSSIDTLNNNILPINMSTLLPNNTKSKSSKATFLRYAPVIGGGIATILDTVGTTNKPDYSNIDSINNIIDNLDTVEPKYIGNYLTYNPLDRNYYINKNLVLSAGTRNAIINLANGNRGAAIAGILGADYNALIVNALLARLAEEYNAQLRERVATFNRATDMYNSDINMKAQVAKRQNDEIKLKAAIEQAKMKEAIDSLTSMNRMANLTNLIDSLGEIGLEAMVRNMILSNPSLYYDIGRDGNILYKKQSKGGYLTVRKKRKYGK